MKRNPQSGEQDRKGQEAKQRCNFRQNSNLNLTLQGSPEHKSPSEVPPPQGKAVGAFMCQNQSWTTLGWGAELIRWILKAIWAVSATLRIVYSPFYSPILLFQDEKIAYYLERAISNTLWDTCFIVPHYKQKLWVLNVGWINSFMLYPRFSGGYLVVVLPSSSSFVPCMYYTFHNLTWAMWVFIS